MRQSGFSLVELLIVMAVASLLGFGILSVFVNMNRMYVTQNAVIDVQSQARNAVYSISRMLREAGLDPHNSANAGVELATASKVRIARDGNLNGIIDNTGLERVSFDFDAVRGIVRRGYYEGTAAERWEEMCDQVAVFSLTYQDENGTDLGVPGADAALLARVRAIGLVMTVRDDKADGGTFTRTVSTSVRSRNL